MHVCRVHFVTALVFSGVVFPTNGAHFHTFYLKSSSTVFSRCCWLLPHPYNSVLSAREDFSLTRVFRGPVVKCTSLGEEVTINDARFVASDEISRLVVSLNAVFCLQAYKLAIMTFVMQISGTDDSRQDSLTRKNIVDPCKVLETLSSTLHLF